MAGFTEPWPKCYTALSLGASDVQAADVQPSGGMLLHRPTWFSM